MKKFLSLMLAGLMSASLFVVGAAAEGTLIEGVVGPNHGVKENEFNAPVSNGGNNINVKVEKVTHKYAVDLKFSFGDLTIGNLEWNVDTMRYDTVKGEELKNTTREITVSNRSDLPIEAYATVSPAADKAPDLTIGMTGKGDSETNKLTVSKAVQGQGNANGDPTTGTLTVKLESNAWDSVAQHYINMQFETPDSAQTYTVATVTVIISKSAQ